MSTAPIATREIDAVNTLLSIVGELPITTLEGALNADALLARRTLQDTLIEFQNEGWWFNTEDNFDLVPDSQGEINVAESVRNVDIDPRDSFDVDVVLRGRKLYDRKNHTYKFTRPLKAKLTHALAFDDLPQSAKNYVIAWSAMRYQVKVLGVTDMHTALSQEYVRARTTFINEDIRNSDRNYLDLSPNSRMGFNSIHRVLRRGR